MLVKICGITSFEDILLCDSEGADFLGFIFVKGSKRFVLKPEEVLSTKTQAKKVAVLRDPDKKDIKVFKGFDFIQLHGLENEIILEEVKSIGAGIIKTIFPDIKESVNLCKRLSPYVDFFLVDSSSKLKGFDSSRFSETSLLEILEGGKIFGRDFFISGGLTPTNVRQFIDRFKPAGVDVSSGVEYEIGKKDPQKVKDFIKNAKMAESKKSEEKL